MAALHASRPLTVGDVTLVVIERVGIQSAGGDAGIWSSGFKEACAIVVSDASGVRVLGMDSTEIEPDLLMQKIPDLGSLLAGLGKSRAACLYSEKGGGNIGE